MSVGQCSQHSFCSCKWVPTCVSKAKQIWLFVFVVALDRPLWRSLAVSGAMHWIGARWTMMMMMIC